MHAALQNHKEVTAHLKSKHLLHVALGFAWQYTDSIYRTSDYVLLRRYNILGIIYCRMTR